MASDSNPKPSFSRARKWTIACNVILSILAVSSVAVMVNYLSGRYPQRFYLSTRTRVELSPRTTHFLQSLTNRISVILYYSRDDSLYSDIAELLREYHAHNPRIIIRPVDYERDPGAAQEVKAKYKDKFLTASDKDLVIFDCEGRTRIVYGEALAEKTWERVPSEPGERPQWRRKPVAFLGEMMFTGALLAVSNPKPLQAYILQGHGEHPVDDGSDPLGYFKFAFLLQTNFGVGVRPLSLTTNPVPANCDLLIIPGPKNSLLTSELESIEKYLNDGGRLLVLFNTLSLNRETGLEQLLARWGVKVGNSVVKDPDNTTASGLDILVGDFGMNPAVNPLTGERLQLILPREIARLDTPPPAGEGIKVSEIAFTGTNAYLVNAGAAQRRGPFSLMAAVEKNGSKGVASGSTRMLVVGDSIFLGNRQIDSLVNRDFAAHAANWLLDRLVLLQGLGPKPVAEYRLLISRKEGRTMDWILLAGMPGGILLLGGLVWLRRRT